MPPFSKRNLDLGCGFHGFTHTMGKLFKSWKPERNHANLSCQHSAERKELHLQLLLQTQSQPRLYSLFIYCSSCTARIMLKKSTSSLRTILCFHRLRQRAGSHPAWVQSICTTFVTFPPLMSLSINLKHTLGYMYIIYIFECSLCDQFMLILVLRYIFFVQWVALPLCIMKGIMCNESSSIITLLVFFFHQWPPRCTLSRLLHSNIQSKPTTWLTTLIKKYFIDQL